LKLEEFKDVILCNGNGWDVEARKII